MNKSIVGRLIAKDLYAYRWLIAAAFVAGVASLVLSSTSEGDNVSTGPNLGIILFMTTIIAFGIFIPMIGILKERQDKSQLFVLSLPVSAAQYSFAKVLAALIAFLGPWLVLTAGVVVLTLRSDRPHGGIPFFVVTMTFFLVTFCVLMTVVVTTMSEVWSVIGILMTNVSVTLFLFKVGRLPGVAGRAQDAVATWSPTILVLLGIEIVLILASLALALFLPSRKRDFV
jgi:ABC-type transport system involved in multi-copper enzyme maturation permease subunit